MVGIKVQQCNFPCLQLFFIVSEKRINLGFISFHNILDVGTSVKGLVCAVGTNVR